MLSLRTRWMLRRFIDAFQVHDALPVPIESIARRMGFQVEYHECLAALYGFISMEDGGRRIVVNGSLSRPWLRATIAHELGHWVCGHLHEGGRAASHIGAGPDDAEERQATVAAALLLIPPRVVKGYTSAARIAAICDVPLELAEVRLEQERLDQARAAARWTTLPRWMRRWFGLPLEGIS